MFIDAFDLVFGDTLQADVCIVGAGAAGITVAREFIKTNHKVILLESGGENFQHRTQFLYQAENTGREYLPMEYTKRRQFGGSTVTWFGRCRPLDVTDFESRPWASHGGWPISKADLDPFYIRAGEYCQLVSNDFEVENDFFENDRLETKRFHFSPPTDFGKLYKGELARAGNIDIILNANVVHVGLNKEGTRVEQVTCRTLHGGSLHVRAKIFVLAASALENTRLLLASRDVQTNGIGNQYDLVGRFFMEHPHFFSAVVDSLPQGLPFEYTKLNYETVQKNLITVDALGLKQDVMRREGLLNACAFLVSRPFHKTEDIYHSNAVLQFLRLIDIIRHQYPLNQDALESLSVITKNMGPVLRFVRSALSGRVKGGKKYTLRMQVETMPNPGSRIRLSEGKDALGQPKLSVHWKTSSLDVDSFNRYEHILFDVLNGMGMKVKKIGHEYSPDGWPVSMRPGKHHMGTTRMHQNEKHGVVDEHCRVHGVPNLYIAGGSVFPTCGMANPTLTIVALAVRMADHIKRIVYGA